MSDQPSGPGHPSDRGADGPDPFSREGAALPAPGEQPPGGLPPGPGPQTDRGPAAYPLYPPHPTDPAAPPAGPGGWAQQPAGDPGTPPPYQPAPPYQPPWAEQPPAGHGSAPDPYGQGGYGAPAQPAVPAAPGQPYGHPGSYGYGHGPTDHPQAVPALVTGIIGLVLSLFCGVGGLVGIAGVVQGRRAKREIDGDPARWTGRSKANAGLVTGVVGLAVLGLWALFFVIGTLASS